MSEIHRLYKYKSLLSGRRVLTAGQLAGQLEISHATFKRDLSKLRDQFLLPIRFDRERGGYCLDQDNKVHELPGLWLDSEDIASLSVLQHLAGQLQPGVAGGKLEAIGSALTGLMRKNGIHGPSIAQHTGILHARKRRVDSGLLDAINLATLTRRRLRITHFHRARGETSVREVSPQKIILYRDNWYLATWCHMREALRLFAVDAFREVEVLPTPCLDLEIDRVDEALTASYGGFLGKRKGWALMRFTPYVTRWVADEIWHPRQVARTLPDGSLELRIPFADERELVGDILRFGADVVVLEPQSLRTAVQKVLLGAAARYVEAVL